MKKIIVSLAAIMIGTSAFAFDTIKLNASNYITAVKDTSKYKEVEVKQINNVGNFPAIKGQKISHYIMQYGVKCDTREAALFSTTSYNMQGEVVSVNKVPFVNKMWSPTDTTDQYGQPRITKKIADAVCK
ncbi:MAG: hypothetical protein K6A44_01120 [bacterium]|nr:hypothetical protein [bacterium]